MTAQLVDRGQLRLAQEIERARQQHGDGAGGAERRSAGFVGIFDVVRRKPAMTGDQRRATEVGELIGMQLDRQPVMPGRLQHPLALGRRERDALATDFNPGSSPLLSPRLIMNMACTLFRLTPAEALAGFTVHAAAALGLGDEIGRIAPGLRAELALWNVERPAELAYLIGPNPLATVIRPQSDLGRREA